MSIGNDPDETETEESISSKNDLRVRRKKNFLWFSNEVFSGGAFERRRDFLSNGSESSLTTK